MLAEFEVTLVEGDPFVWDDWMRAGVDSASRIVILAHPHDSAGDVVDGAERAINSVLGGV